MVLSDTTILRGQEAADEAFDNWQKITLGMVDIEVVGGYLIVRRDGGDYSLFLPLEDGTEVFYIAEDNATTHDIPREERADASLSEEAAEMAERALDNLSGGTYPVADGDAFAVSFHDPEDDERKYLHVSVDPDETLDVRDEV
jgi:hypothetical protein